MNTFSCQCGNPLFFENSVCLQCLREVGFDPVTLTMQPLGAEAAFRRCANGVNHGVCNWLLSPKEEGDHCVSCRLNQVIPNLSSPDILSLWSKMEASKRRATYSLLSMGLPLQPLNKPGNFGAVDEFGNTVPLRLSYRLLQSYPHAQVMTGHDAGVITLNLEEADDAIRERNRVNLREPYRTLLGHFRHELGHYYWSMWFENDAARDEVLPTYRQLFGDERPAYTDALKNYYQNGPNPAWQESSISPYATMHSWEDWAETWAHYLHMTDFLESFESLGLRKSSAKGVVVANAAAIRLPAPFEKVDAAPFVSKLQRWVEITPALNELSASLGHNMLYPFVVSPAVVQKLFFIHCMVQRQVADLAALEKSQQRKTRALGWISRILGT